MEQAIAAFVRPATDDLLLASIANGGTFLGALCFLRAAWLLLVELADTADDTAAAAPPAASTDSSTGAPDPGENPGRAASAG